MALLALLSSCASGDKFKTARAPASLAAQRQMCEMSSTRLTLLMRGDVGRIDPAVPVPSPEITELAPLVTYIKENPQLLRYRRFPWLDNFQASERQRLFALSVSLRFNESFMAKYADRLHPKINGDWDQDLPAKAAGIDQIYQDWSVRYQKGEAPKRIAIDQIKEVMKNRSPRPPRSIFEASSSEAIRKMGATKACGDIGVKDPDECVRAAIYSHDKIMDVMNINTYPGESNAFADISNLKVSIEVLDSSLKDPYLQGLWNYEKILREHLARPQDIRSDIFSDLVTSFEKAGDQKQLAQEKALNVLSVISTNGSDFILNEQLFNKVYWTPTPHFEPPNPKFVSLVRLSMALPYFDLVKPGNLYSLPANVISECDTSKYYHFWMSAFIFQQLRKAGFSKESAAAAVLVNHIGYRSLYDPFAANFAQDHPGFVILKADIAGVYSGIVFASRLGGSKPDEPLDFQSVLDSIREDRSYRDLMGSVASAAMPSAKAYMMFMKRLGVIPLWNQMKSEIGRDD
ncbi:MAG: hypothetical protein KF681_08515 [Bdellovibrionaceae bacterium]|nr:hypothetical protein [Pseudobdellovibrionaceae bacterium]